MTSTTDDNLTSTVLKMNHQNFLSYSCLPKDVHFQIPPNDPLPFACRTNDDKKLSASYWDKCCSEDLCNEFTNETLPGNFNPKLPLPDEGGKEKHSLSLAGEKTLKSHPHCVHKTVLGRLSRRHHSHLCYVLSLHCLTTIMLFINFSV